MVTSSGMCFSSMRRRTKPNSVSEADGKAISISLKPMAQSVLNICIFFSAFIGSNKAWLPSRKSVLIQIGGVVMTRLGHWRSTSWIGAKAVYLAAGFGNMMTAPVAASIDSMEAMLRKKARQVLALFALFGRLLAI